MSTPPWIVCSAVPLKPGLLVGWSRSASSPPLLLIDEILEENAFTDHTVLETSDNVFGKRAVIGYCSNISAKMQADALKNSGYRLHLNPLSIQDKDQQFPVTLIGGSFSFINPSFECSDHVGLCIRLLARNRAPPRPYESFFSPLRRFDLLQRTADDLIVCLPSYLFPNIRAVRPSNNSSASWLGDRLAGIFFALIILTFASSITTFFVDAVSTFVTRYCALIDGLLEAGMGAGVWGVKLNAPLMSTAHRIWLQGLSAARILFPPVGHPTWCYITEIIVRIVAFFMIAAGGWAAGISLFIDVVALFFVPFFLMQRAVSVLFWLEVSSLQTLARLLIGRKYNVLRLRVDSHDFDMEHYTLGTVFFTLLIFLLPTISFLYGFTVVPLYVIVHPAFFIFRSMAKLSSRFPLASLCLWLSRSERIADGVVLVPQPNGYLLKPKFPSLVSLFTRSLASS